MTELVMAWTKRDKSDKGHGKKVHTKEPDEIEKRKGKKTKTVRNIGHRDANVPQNKGHATLRTQSILWRLTGKVQKKTDQKKSQQGELERSTT